MRELNFHNTIKNEFIKFKPTNQVNGNNEIEIHGPIGGDSIFDFGYSFDTFKRDLEQMSGDITVSIKSYGGNLFEALAIYDAIRGLKNNVTTKIVGATASAGTLISLAGDKRLITKNSRYLIHKPIVMAAGNSDDFKKILEQLEDLDKQMVDLYVERTNLNAEEVIDLMRREEFISPKQALLHGFIDGYVGDKSQENSKNNNNMEKQEVLNQFINDNNDKIDIIMEFIDKLSTDKGTETTENKVENEVENTKDNVETTENEVENTESLSEGSSDDVENKNKSKNKEEDKDKEEEEDTKNEEDKDEEEDDDTKNEEEEEDDEDKDKVIEDLREEIEQLKKKLADNEVDDAQNKAEELETYLNDAISRGVIMDEAKDEWLNIGSEQGIEVVKTLMSSIPEKQPSTRLKDVVSTSKTFKGKEDIVAKWKKGDIDTETYLNMVQKQKS